MGLHRQSHALALYTRIPLPSISLYSDHKNDGALLCARCSVFNNQSTEKWQDTGNVDVVCCVPPFPAPIKVTGPSEWNMAGKNEASIHTEIPRRSRGNEVKRRKEKMYKEMDAEIRMFIGVWKIKFSSVRCCVASASVRHQFDEINFIRCEQYRSNLFQFYPNATNLPPAFSSGNPRLPPCGRMQ